MGKPAIQPALFNYYGHADSKNSNHIPKPFDPDNLINSTGVTVGISGANLEGTSGVDLIVATDGTHQLFGLAGDDLIIGGPGEDSINGGEGADIMVGGQGDDSYVVDNIKDQVIERSGEGVDSIATEISLTLPENVENLRSFGPGQADLVLTGNALDNIMTGAPFYSVTFLGMDGNDTLYATGRAGGIADGGSGNDVLLASVGQLTGGPGADTFVAAGRGAMSNPETPIVVTDFNAAESDKLVIYAPQAYSTQDLLASGALQFSAATSKLVLDLDPATGGETVDQVLILMGLQSFDPVWLSVVEDPL